MLGANAEHDTLRDHLASAFGRLLRRDAAHRERREHWALREVSFDVAEGEVLAIIGRNGAGKSTLLKILSQISEPTEGHIRIRGRVASLLEVGTGFHPELSGRENIYLNGAILGMSRAEIRAKFDEIVAFAEVEKFLDTPVKRYSSGMSVRLGFAVAAHLEPEILLVDEVLAVGDAAFQAKCLAKMGDISRNRGRTVLFVSHNMQAVQNLCPRAVLLDSGALPEQGATPDVVATYLANIATHVRERIWTPGEAPGNHEIRLRAIRVRGEADTLLTSQATWVELEFDCLQVPNSLCLGVDIVSPSGEVVFRSFHSDTHPDRWLVPVVGPNRWRFKIPAGLLNIGNYLVAPRIARFGSYWICKDEPCLQFTMTLDHGVSPYWNAVQSRGNRPGLIAPILEWESLPPTSPSPSR